MDVTRRTTPPASASRSSSPSKKRKIDDGTSEQAAWAVPPLRRSARTPDQDPDATPRSNRSQASRQSATVLSLRTTLPHPSSIHSSSGASLPSSSHSALPSTNPPSTASDRRARAPTSQTSRRSASPVKNIAGLLQLDKPVHFDSAFEFTDHRASKAQPPPDVVELVLDIKETMDYKKGIYPAEIREKIASITEGRLPLDIAFREPAADPETGPYEDNIDSDDEYNHLPLLALASGVPSSRQARIAYGEFYKVRTIKRCARKCLALRLSEAEWNSDVHKPLLNLALTTWSGDASVACQNVTSARILPCFLPFTSTGDVAEGKMVDFVLGPKIPEDSELDIAIRDALRSRAVQQQQSPASNAAHHCVNQTDYPVLSRAPIAVTIETKVAGANLDEGRLHLGIWTAAWHHRMRILGVGGDAGGPPLPTLPLILTWDHEWKLFFAVDRVHKIVGLATAPRLVMAPFLPPALVMASLLT